MDIFNDVNLEENLYSGYFVRLTQGSFKMGAMFLLMIGWMTSFYNVTLATMVAVAAWVLQMRVCSSLNSFVFTSFNFFTFIKIAVLRM